MTENLQCCATPAAPDNKPLLSECPRCGERGRRVKPITLDSLLKPGVPRSDAAWRFCRTPTCPAVYFAETTGEVLLAEQLRVPVGIKEHRAERPICYCFGHSAADIQAAAHRTPTIFQQVSERCRRGEDRCEETNPQGACCLGNIRAIEKGAPPATPERSCCSS